MTGQKTDKIQMTGQKFDKKVNFDSNVAKNNQINDETVVQNQVQIWFMLLLLFNNSLNLIFLFKLTI